MQIKRFEAKDMTTALRMVKEELGSDAVILSARSIRKGKGFLGSLKYAGVEVSAAIDKQMPATKTARVSSEKAPYRHYSAGRLENANPGRRGVNQAQTALPSGGPVQKSRIGRNKKSSSHGRIKVLSSLYQQILLQEVDRAIASELIEEIKRIPASDEILSSGDIKSHIGFLLEEMGVTAQSGFSSHGKQTITALVGPTGVGKTTTIAKLAARQVNKGQKRVGLVTIDNYSIAAIHQLETYASLMGIPLIKANGAGELKKAVKLFSNKELILIDTPGVNPRDPDQIQELNTTLSGPGNLNTHLVLSATTKEKDCIFAAEAFKYTGFRQILFTKIDESSIFGNIVNVLIYTHLPLSFLGCGRRVPDDIEVGTVQRLVDLLLVSKKRYADDQAENLDFKNEPAITKEDTPEKLSPFVANKNSDVYHAIDCKWAKKIKPANTIKFSRALEAEAQNFLPCRSCHPDRRHERLRTKPETEMMQHYG